MPTNCVIYFDHSDGIYNSGDTINGHIKLHTTNTKPIRGIYIKIYGYADVKWEERRNRGSKRPTEYYSISYKAHEQYLNSITYFSGQEYGNSFDLLPGIYEYAFSCTLPRELPTSCEETNGKIIYETIVVIDRPLNYNNEFKKPFTVNHCVDLNWNSENKLPKIQNDTRGICCLYCCFTSGAEIQVALKIPFGGIIPGQIIPFALTIFNDSNIDIQNSKVNLKKVMTFECTQPYSKCTNVVTDLDTKNFDPVLHLSHKEFTSSLYAPTRLPCTQVGKCIRIQYFVNAKICMGCCINDIELEIPITVGLIPLVDNDDATTVITAPPTVQPSSVSLPTAPTQTTQSTPSPSPTPPPPLLDIIPDMNSLPPSYEDAIKMTERCNAANHKKKNKFKQFSINSEGHSSRMPTAPSDSDIVTADSASTSTSNANRNYGFLN